MTELRNRALFAFDLDGTLVDSAEDLANALNEALDREGLPRLPEALVRSFVGNGARMLVERALTAATDGAAGPPSSTRVDEVLAIFREAYGRTLLQRTKPYPGLVDVVQALRGDGHPLAVATNKPGIFARPIVDALFPGLFDVVIGPDDAGALKPDPAMLALCEARTQAVLLAYVGDSEVDVEVAARRGVPAIAVGWGLRSDQDLAGASTTVHDSTTLLRAMREVALLARRRAGG